MATQTATTTPDQQEDRNFENDVAGRSSIEKQPVDARPSAFERLPDEIIEQILRLTDPNSFASLVLLNSKWRSVSQQADLYALQLAQCPSYAASHKGRPVAAADDRLAELRRLFAREVKRNLFDAYLRPSLTLVKLVSNSISSSSCPGGDGMQFQPSPKGHHLLAYNSSRIYVVDAQTPEISVKRELKILRRPAATCIMDDGSLLAVLLTEMQVDLYDLRASPPKRTQSIILDHSPRAIALSPCGSVLAAAYEGGIEVSSLNPGALPTERRSVKCDGVDALAFSFDGTQILGTTVHAAQPNTVILTAPYYDPGSHMESDNISALWTTSILFPNTSRDCSHAVLLQDASCEEASWTFTYDRSFETFRAVRIDDLRNGTTYFTGPIPSQSTHGRLLPCTLPAASYHGDLVAAGFQGKDIWIYGVPEDLDAVPEPPTTTSEGTPSAVGGLNRRGSGPSMRSSPRAQEQSDARVPQWQLLCDKLRNSFVGGRKIAELNGANTVKWVAGFGGSSLKERLVAAAAGVLPSKLVTEEDAIDFVDGGRLVLIDFDYGTADGQVNEVTIEVGTKEPEVLEEETRDMDVEVAIVRRRTVAQRRGNQSSVMRAATIAARMPPVPLPPVLPPTRSDDADDPLVPRRIGVPPVAAPRQPSQNALASDEGDTQSVLEEQEALDAPYSHASPRSGTTLRRAATAAAVNRRLHPPPAAAGNVQYRRADGRAEHPHESDADNWVPPPPPYQKEDPVDLPSFMRHNVTPVSAGVPPVTPIPNPIGPVVQAHPPQAHSPQLLLAPCPAQVSRSQTVHNPQNGTAAQHWQPTYALASHQRQGSGASAGRPRASDVPRPAPSPLSPNEDEDIYDVSPPGTPPLSRAPNMVRPSSESSGVTLPSTGPNSSTFTSTNQPAPLPTPSPVVSNLGQDTPMATAPAFTPSTVASTPAQKQGPPVLDLQIPTATLSPATIWNTPQTANKSSSAVVKTLVTAQTWPRQIGPDRLPQAALTGGYPQSAPPISFSAGQAIAESIPPVPKLQNVDGANQNGEQKVASSQRQSGGFQVPRVPVGSRDPSRRVSLQQQPQQQQGQQSQVPYSPSQHPLQQNPVSSQNPALHQPRAQRLPNITTANNQPDMPLIISTPRGIAGAYDLPGQQPSEGRAETPIVAPVPRHPRATPGSSGPNQPTAERLEGIYSASGHRNARPLGLGLTLDPPGGLALPAPPSTDGGRNSSLNRKQSRAERSAAKNMADAKRRGWRRSKSKRLTRRGKNDDGNNNNNNNEAGSTVAWTEVTARTPMPAVVLGPDSTANSAIAGYQARPGSRASKDKKCVVM